MAAGGWVQLINYGNPEQPNAVGAKNTFSLITDIVAPRAVPAGTLFLGSTLRWTAWGILSTTSTPNLTLSLMYGGSAGTALAATAATATASGASNVTWRVQAESVVTALTANSTTGLTIATLGQCWGIGATQTTIVPMPTSSSTGNAVASLDPTTNKALTIAATWSASSVSNSINCFYFAVELLN